MSTLGVYHDECGGYHEYTGGVQYTGGYHEYIGDTKMHVGGYHEYTGGCSVHRRDTMSAPGISVQMRKR